MNEKEIEYVLYNKKFMNWVVEKLEKHFYIDDHDSKLDENDYTEAQNIKYLFDIVSEYALANGIKTDRSMQFNLYYIDYEGKLFFVYEGTTSYGCFNVGIDKKHMPFCIDFDDVRKFKLDEMLDNDDNLFYDIKTNIIDLHNQGISLEFINQSINRIIHNIKKEEKGHTYKKK